MSIYGGDCVDCGMYVHYSTSGSINDDGYRCLDCDITHRKTLENKRMTMICPKCKKVFRRGNTIVHSTNGQAGCNHCSFREEHDNKVILLVPMEDGGRMKLTYEETTKILEKLSDYGLSIIDLQQGHKEQFDLFNIQKVSEEYFNEKVNEALDEMV